jgi:hypothetical protein
MHGPVRAPGEALLVDLDACRIEEIECHCVFTFCASVRKVIRTYSTAEPGGEFNRIGGAGADLRGDSIV